MRISLPLFIVAAWLLLVIAGLLLPLTPDEIDLSGILHGPSFQYWLGQDDLGRPVLDRLLLGAQTSLLVGVSVVLLTALVGISIGTLAAWRGGWVDHLLIRVIDVFMAFPGILLAIALAGILGPGINNLVIALTVVGWVGFARLTRAQVLSIKHREHVLAAKAMGTTTGRIITWHLLPLIAAPLIVEATFGIAGIVIAEAGLSFLGLGVQPPEASWGNMIRDGARYMLVAPHLVIAPGVALAMVVLAINLLGDQLRDRLAVR
jgi:peptide/nickel transport system permease protein